MSIVFDTPGFRSERGLLWPSDDTECARVVFDRTADLQEVYKHVADWRVCVQAGGNCGVWPIALAGRFDAVYTFEPDPVNFTALSVNTASRPNIIRLQAALGNNRGFVDLEREPGNCGAHFVAGAGHIPTLRIDDLGLQSCGLIVLDIEGMERIALVGAIRTIQKHRPVILVEDKGLSEKYGSEKGDIERWLQLDYDYRVVSRPGRDVVMVTA